MLIEIGPTQSRKLQGPMWFVCMPSYFSHVQLFATLGTVACQAPLFMGFFRQEYWSWLPCPSSKGSSLRRDQTGSLAISCIGSQFLYHYCLQGSPPHGGIANECWVMCHQYSQIRGPHPSIKYENQNLMREFFYMLFGDCFFYTSLGSIERYSS